MVNRANSYIDVGYVVDSGKRLGFDHLRLNLGRLGSEIVKLCGWSPQRTFLYDGVGDDEANESEERRMRRQWLERNDLERNTHLRRGRIASEKREQKRVDVQLAVDVLRDAHGGAIDAVVLLAADDDFTPLVEATREIGPHVGLVLLPGTNHSKGLIRAADLVHNLDFGNAHWKDAIRDQSFV